MAAQAPSPVDAQPSRLSSWSCARVKFAVSSVRRARNVAHLRPHVCDGVDAAIRHERAERQRESEQWTGYRAGRC
jgi:hypothetical protein